METFRSYFEDTYRFADHAIVQSMQQETDQRYFITLDRTLFYPQGGGQPSDQGFLTFDDTEIPITAVKMVNGEIRHYTDQHYSSIVGRKVDCCLNQEKRLVHAKLHTAGHAISHIVESLHPNYKATKGHHYPGESYVEFTSENGKIESINLDVVNEQIALLLAEKQVIETMFTTHDKLSELYPNMTYHIPQMETIRVVRIGNFRPQPCGGTHVKTTLEIQGLHVTKAKVKNHVLKLSYEIKELT